MSCCGERLSIIAVIFIFFVCLHVAIAQDDNNPHRGEEEKLCVTGNLYDVFKKRLDRFQSELSIGDDQLIEKELPNSTNNLRKLKPEDEDLKFSVDRLCNILSANLGNTEELSSEGDELDEYPEAFRESKYDEYKRRLEKYGTKVVDPTDDRNAKFWKESRNVLIDESGTERSIIKNQLNEDKYTPIREDLNKGYRKQSNNFKDDPYQKRNRRSRVIDEQDYYQFLPVKSSKASGLNVNAATNDDYQYDFDNSDYPEVRNTFPNVAAFLNDKRYFKRTAKNVNSLVSEDPKHPPVYSESNTLYENIHNPTGASYPSVLTKPLESSSYPTVNILPPRTLLASVAQKMNTTTLELAKKLANIPDLTAESLKNNSVLGQTLRSFIESSVIPNIKDKVTKHCSEETTTTCDGIQSTTPEPQKCGNLAAEADISKVLEKVLINIKHLQQAKVTETCSPEGAPCDVVGAWNSLVMGLRFDISVGNCSDRVMGSAEDQNKLLNIDTKECNPPRQHDTVSLNWKFMGSGMKQLGGPFYMYAQKREDNMLSLFAGYCRTCGGTDTIFGAWLFLYPSKDCQDISASIQIKRDIFRRSLLDSKRKERMKDILYEQSKLAKSGCMK